MTPKHRYVMIFDTETTGLPERGPKGKIFMPTSSLMCYESARIIQLAFLILNLDTGEICTEYTSIINPTGPWIMDPMALNAHGISSERVACEGVSLATVVEKFFEELRKCSFLVCHNAAFDVNVLCSELCRDATLTKYRKNLQNIRTFCTMMHMTREMNLPYKTGKGRGKWPKLEEMHIYLFGENFEGAHDAMNDVRATARCFIEIINRQRNSDGKTENMREKKKIHVLEEKEKEERDNSKRPKHEYDASTSILPSMHCVERLAESG